MGDGTEDIFFRHHPEPMWVLDAVTLGVLDANHAAIRHYGYGREEFLAMRLQDLTGPEDLKALQALPRAGSGSATTVQLHLRRRSGESSWVELSTSPLPWRGSMAMLACARDITPLVELRHERDRAMAREAAARRAADSLGQRFEALFAVVPGKFMVLAPANFEILAVSDDYLASVNTTREKLIGRPLFSILTKEQVEASPDAAHTLRQSLETVVATRRPDILDMQRFPVYNADGQLETRYWSSVNSPVLDANGELACIFHRLEDVTALVEQGGLPAQDMPAQADSPAAFELVLRTRELADRARRLEAQVAELRSVQGLLAMATWRLLPDTGTLEVSPGFHQLLGTSGSFRPTLEGYLALVHPDDQAAMRQALAEFCQPGTGQFHIRHRIIRSDDGRVRSMMVVGEFQAGARAINFLTQDITTQLETAQELGRMAMLTRLAGRVARLGGWRFDVTADKLEWDPETFAIFGLPQGKPLDVDDAIRFYAPEHRQQILDAFTACVQHGEPFDELVQFIDAHQRRFWVRAIGEAVRDASGRVVIAQGAVQDVDELVRTRMEAEELSNRLATTLESISDAFFLLDEQWRFSYLNSHAERLVRRRREELLGKRLWDEFPEALGSMFQTGFEQVMDTGETVRFDEDYPPLDMRVRVAAYRVPEGIAVYFSDITHQHQQDALARLNDERFRLIAKATNDAVWDWDLVQDTLWWNEGIRTLFGYAPEKIEPTMQFWLSRIHPDDLVRVMSSIEGAVAGTENTWVGEYRFLHADGRALSVIDRGFVIRDETGRAVRMVGSMLDITERLKLDAQLRQAQKLEAVGHLTGGVAHDFNNLLTVILGNATLLAERLAREPRLQALATMIESAAQRGAELTQRMLAFSRQQALAPRIIDVQAQVSSLEAMFRRTLPEDIELRLEYEPGIWPVEVDPGQLEVALLNLVVNARDAMPEGGRLTIETGNVCFDEGYARRHVDVKLGEYVCIIVSDTGTGIPPELLHQVFDPFFTTKEAGKGSGLGLSMVYGFVNQSNGHVHIYSEPGLGTAVKLYLPRASGNGVPEAGAPKQHIAQEAPQGHEHLLVVEDDYLVRQHVVNQLRSLGYRVTDASSGPEALELLKKLDDVALLFTDVVMPGMSGRELAQLVGTIRPEVKILFTSGYTRDTMVHNGRLDPGVNLLSKPYRPQDLAQKIREVLGAPR